MNDKISNTEISLSLVTDIISPQTADLCSCEGQIESENIPIPDNACCPRKNPELCRTLVEALAFPVPPHSTLHAGEEHSSLSEHLNKYESRRGELCWSTWNQESGFRIQAEYGATPFEDYADLAEYRRNIHRW